MIRANVHEAKTQLSKLIERAEAGEEVMIARNGKPVVRLQRIAPQELQGREVGGLSWADWKALDREIEAEFEAVAETPALQRPDAPEPGSQEWARLQGLSTADLVEELLGRR